MRTLFTISILSLLTNLLTAQTITFISSCEAMTICSFENDCGPAFAELIAEASTTCPSGNLTYNYDIDLDNDGVLDQSGSIADASGDFPLGEHKITFTASDDCNNSESCEILFTMKDCLAPAISTFNGLAIDLSDNGTFELFANMFDNGSTDNCGITSWLINSPSMGPGQTEPAPSAGSSVVFNCNDLGTQSVDLWVNDAAGNWTTLPNYVVVKDNLNVCSSESTFELCLYAETECGEPVEGVDYQLDSISNPPGIPNFNCYTISVIDITGPLNITPVKDSDPLNGVSTYDLVFIARHILGTQLLDSPYKIIAADLNSSGSVTTLDLVNLRQIILAQINNFPNTPSWRFVDKDFIFPNPQNPWETSFPEICTINSFDEDISKTFIGIKVGDVSSNTLPCDSLWNPQTEDRSAETLIFELNNQKYAEGEAIRIPFKSNDFKDIAGYQFELDFDPKALQFTGFEQGSLKGLDDTNFGYGSIKAGKIKTSWVRLDQSPEDLSNPVLFYLNFKTLTNGKVSDFIKIAENGLHAESYHTDLKIMGLKLNFTNPEALHFENTPNPFKEETTINFGLQENQMISMSIYDLNGKIVKSLHRQAFKGSNQIHLNFDASFSPGIYFCQFETKEGLVTKKLIKQ